MTFRLDAVTAGYGDTVVLRDVSVAVPPSTVIALIGPNGAGKTTLLRVASGLLRPRRGAVTLDGVDVTRHRPEQLVAAGVCHVPEGRGVFPNLTVRENLVLFGRRDRREMAIELALDAFPRLGGRMGQLAGTLSGGEQQMLALARVYAQEPAVVLLDEVSMGLAPKLVDEIFEFLQRLAASGASLLLVEQFVSKALAMADDVYLLHRGQVTFAGEPSELEGSDVFTQYVGSTAAG